ncbi:Predicted Zn-dependent protease, minimal metalloprotease (MMP)-like domain [Loktanella fryxellensis]|uniref:Predicted Zn-dependent protease, minimal metalloprotease (MMP)-like domain n=1 Tax=Loktanella fryxellensis TaxID=245187 RepID=A0A1H8CD26_9RHOB|nr:metallopeptidase family protein [Loktanella fryxellensis]SEM92168.1 Predicted Zn-dependent protease, minimal metalloprotease (MMP)-like domain [Loktanella fryxellensis]
MSHDLDHFDRVARATVAELPDAFRAAAEQVALRIVDWPDAQMLADLDMTDRAELTGLYDGIPMTEKSVMDVPIQPDTVWLFRQPILLEWRERGDVDLDDLIAHVVIHEFAHHFGWSDDQIAAVDEWWL